MINNLINENDRSSPQTSDLNFLHLPFKLRRLVSFFEIVDTKIPSLSKSVVLR